MIRPSQPLATVAALAILGIGASAQATGTTAAPAPASKAAPWDGTLGPFIGVQYVHAGGSNIDATLAFVTLHTSTSGSSGAAFQFGYGLNRYLTFIARGQMASGQTISAPNITGTQTMYQVDAGLRPQVPVKGTPLVLFAELDVSARSLVGSAQVATIPPAEGQKLDNWGGGVTFGFGALVLFGRAFSAEVAYYSTNGTYSKVQVANVAPLDSHASSTSTSRFTAGLNWYLFR